MTFLKLFHKICWPRIFCLLATVAVPRSAAPSEIMKLALVKLMSMKHLNNLVQAIILFISCILELLFLRTKHDLFVCVAILQININCYEPLKGICRWFPSIN